MAPMAKLCANREYIPWTNAALPIPLSIEHRLRSLSIFVVSVSGAQSDAIRCERAFAVPHPFFPLVLGVVIAQQKIAMLAIASPNAPRTYLRGGAS